MTSDDAIRLTVREPAGALLDDRFHLGAVAPDGAPLRWRARIRDDDGRVWRASGSTAHELTVKWAPAKDGTGPVAALASLRPVAVDVRAEAEDGRAASRTLKRPLVGAGVKSRRWRGEVVAHLHLPPEPVATVLLDATADEEAAAAAAIAGPLLASRGVLALVLPPPRRETPDLVDRAREQLTAVPGAGEPRVVSEIALPPNVPARDPGPEHAVARQRAWDALLAELGARPRA